MKNTFLSIAAFIISLILSGGKTNNQLPYKNPSIPIDERIDDLLGRMTLEEKINMLGGTGFETKAIERLGIPPMNMTDGPVGVRWDKSSSFPSGISMLQRGTLLY
jgi:beta-glucosidase